MDIKPEHKIFIVQKSFVKNDKGEILIIRRSETAPSRPLGWDIAGGSLEFGEDPKEGILREIKEETGIEAVKVSLKDVTSFLEVDSYTLMIIYEVLAKDSKVTLSYEHDQYKWVSKDEFLDLDIPQTYQNLL